METLPRLGKKSLEVSEPGHPVLINPKLRCIWEVFTSEKYSDEKLVQLGYFQSRIVELGKRAWKIVRHVLCDDSPEGHLPEEMEDVEGLDTKDLLSYSFRAIHESRQKVTRVDIRSQLANIAVVTR